MTAYVLLFKNILVVALPITYAVMHALAWYIVLQKLRHIHYTLSNAYISHYFTLLIHVQYVVRMNDATVL